MSVLVPSHITGFFNIENHDMALKKGSCGAGFLIDKGVKTTIEPCDDLQIQINRGDESVIREVLNIFNLDETFKITQDIQLPIGAGFGTSAASALSLTLAINQHLNLRYSIETCGQIAHRAEINLGGGLGDVIAQTGHGIVLRTQAGAPGIGEIKSFKKDVYIGCKTFGEINTSDIINDEKFKDIISANGLKYLDLFKKEPTLENFLTYSYEFSKKIDLMSEEVKDLTDYFNSLDEILGSSMAMLGNTAFAFSYDKDFLKDLDIKNLEIYKLNNFGIVYD